MKAYLIYLEIPFKKTHEIGELITRCDPKDSDIAALREEADILTDYAVTVRYPDDLYIPSQEEAEEAYELAKKVKNYVLSKLSFDLSRLNDKKKSETTVDDNADSDKEVHDPF